jgi:hypothetical protein
LMFDVTDPYVPKMCGSAEWSGDSAQFCVRIAQPAEFAATGASGLLKPALMELRQPGHLRSPARQADYWIVTPKEFLSPALRLARYRSGRVAGITQAVAMVATLDDVYDEYTFGMEEPGAIKLFLSDKHPAYGLLAGDATCDYRGMLGERPPGVPAYEYGFGLNPDAYGHGARQSDVPQCLGTAAVRGQADRIRDPAGRDVEQAVPVAGR